MLVKLKMSQETYYAVDTAIKVFGIIALIISGVFTWSQFKDGQEREYKKTFYEKQLSVIGSVFDVMSEIDAAQSSMDRDKALKKFWMIYQGTGRAFLSSKMFESLDGMPLEYVQGCIAKLKKSKIIPECNNFSASESMAGFAKMARKELSKNWSQEFASIGAEDPWLPQSLQRSK